jgi:pyruvate dehydrogenase E2 component (dihydrolipoamide acetyltransferase)
MPKWGLSMTEGKVGRWLVEEGAEVSPGVELLEIETDKILSSLESPFPGILRRKVAREGDQVPVAGLLAVIAGTSVSDSEIDVFITDFQSAFLFEKSGSEVSGPLAETTLVNGQTLRWLKRGTGGEAAILLHGFGGDMNNWLFNHEDLATTGAVYALDLPGHGGSSKHVGRGDLAEFAQVLNGFMDALGLSKTHLVGHSLGGGVAFEFALTYPERVVSLALIASAALGPEIDCDYISGFIASGRRKQIEPQLQKLFANPKLIDRQLIEDVLKYKRLDGVESALRTIAANFCPGGRQAVVLRYRLAELSVPILVIWGTEDRIIPPSHAHDLPENIRTTILPGSGHMVQMEAHAKVNQIIRLFWEASRQPSTK